MKINEVELATNLASRELRIRYTNDNGTEFPNGIIKDITAECTEYTEEAQEVFDRLYDFYCTQINVCEI